MGGLGPKLGGLGANLGGLGASLGGLGATWALETSFLEFSPVFSRESVLQECGTQPGRKRRYKWGRPSFYVKVT